MESLIVIVDDLADLPYENMVNWVTELNAKNLGAVPILEAKSLTEFNLILNIHQPHTILLAAPNLAEQLYYPSLIKELKYSVRIGYHMGLDTRVVILPCPSECSSLKEILV